MLSMVCVVLLSSCAKENTDDFRNSLDEEIVMALNSHVDGLYSLVNSLGEGAMVSALSRQDDYYGNSFYLIHLNDGSTVSLYSSLGSKVVPIPNVSVLEEGGVFFWTIGSSAMTVGGKKLSVKDPAQKPVLLLAGEEWEISVENKSDKSSVPMDGYNFGNPARLMEIANDTNDETIGMWLASGQRLSLAKEESFDKILTESVNRSFYKDIFMDGAYGLNSRVSLNAAAFLNCSLECISGSSQKAQNLVIASNYNDANGRLLYPDGQPRYRVLFVNGGSSKTHGQSLGEEGLDRMKSFVHNGGSYVGTCAGAFLASNGYDNNLDYEYYLHLWPGCVRHTGLESGSTGMFIDSDSPLMKYYRYGGDYYIANVRHNKGGYPVNIPEGTEILARYDYPESSAFHNQPSVWAYKESERTGRIVMTGSHPEEVTGGERLELTAAMLRYAMEGQGTVALKGILRNGYPRLMNQSYPSRNVAYSKIGDLQCHHFAVYIPSTAHNIKFFVTSESGYDMRLLLAHDDFAFPESAEYRSEQTGYKQTLAIDRLEEGYWYLAVQCMTTVSVEDTEIGQNYSGKTDVLNGVEYTVSVTWE